MVWGLSALLAAVAGMASANVMDISFFLPNMGIKGLTVALFGGLDSIPGALLGGLILGIFENAAAVTLIPGGRRRKRSGRIRHDAVNSPIPAIRSFGQIRIERI